MGTTKIKNKTTGETLTGEKVGPLPLGFWFRINGCKETNAIDASEWEILPPPLPTGIGAVVRAESVAFVRIHKEGKESWRLANAGDLTYSDSEVLWNGPLTVLSEGVTL